MLRLLSSPTEILHHHRTLDMMLKRCCGVSHRSILVGLTTIVVTNCAGLTGNKRKQKVWSRNRKVRLADSLGSYSRAGKNSPATIWLYVDNIVRAESSWWRCVPLLRYMMPAEVLYHEIGHHIHAVHRPIHEARECCRRLGPQALARFPS